MRIIAIYVVRPRPDPAKPLASELDLSSFGFFNRLSAPEFLSFFACTLASKTANGVRQSVEQNEHIGYVYTNLAGLSGVIITDKEYPQRVAFALINRVLEEFSAIHSREQWLSCSGQLEFPQLARMLQQFQNPQQADSIMRVQREIDETKVILHSTINSLLERGEKLEDLVARSDQLGAQSRAFFKSAKKTSSCCVIQ